MKISVITNGISEDYAKVCRVMKETGVKYDEIQNAFDKAVENFTMDGVDFPVGGAHGQGRRLVEIHKGM